MIFTRTCKHCGKQYGVYYAKSSSKYCSRECKNKAHYERSKEREMRKTLGLPEVEPAKRYCAVCGQTLRSGQTKFCSHDCLRTYHTRVKEARTNAAEQAKLDKSAEKIAQKKRASQSWGEVLKGMEETGLSYGQYVARTEYGR